MLFYVFGRISGDESRDAVMNHRSSAASSPHKRLHGEEDEEEELQVLDFPKSTKMVFFSKLFEFAQFRWTRAVPPPPPPPGSNTPQTSRRAPLGSLGQTSRSQLGVRTN